MIPHRLELYPFPIAHPARLFEVAEDPADRLDKALHFVELSATTLAVLGLAWCRAHGREPGGVRQWEKKLEPSGITLGTWNATIRAASKEMARIAERDPLAAAIRTAGQSAIAGLETFNPTRNTYAHGGKPRTTADQRTAADDLERGVSALLDRMRSLASLRLGVVRQCRGSGRTWTLELEVINGYGRPFATRRLTSVEPFVEGLVLAYHADSLEHSIQLSPYAAWGPCPACGEEELFYLHQRRKQRSLYFSFSTGHELEVQGDVVQQASRPAVALGLEPLSATRFTAMTGWRATWADLAPRPRRIAARAADVVAAVLIAGLGYSSSLWLSGAWWTATVFAVTALLLYEPIASLSGGTPGKRLAGIEPISISQGRTLARSDTLRRALIADLQLIFPPLAVRNLAWVLWDPARQCWHDKIADSIVISGRSQPGQRL